MRILFLLLVVGFCLVTAKHIPHESSATSLVLERVRRSDSDNSDSNAASVERNDDSSNDNDNDDDVWNGSSERKLREKEIKLREREEKLKQKEQERLEKERQKEIEQRKKLEEKLRKQQEKQEKEARKLREKAEKEKRKLEEEQRKLKEKLEKEERKRQEKLKKQLEDIQKDQKDSAEDTYLESEEEDSVEVEDIWKAYVYDKYGLSVTSTKLERQAALQRYLYEEMGITANSTKTERRQAILKLIQTKLQNDPATVDSFRNLFISHVNAAQIQKIRVKLENDIEELNNKTQLLNNITLPGTSVAKQNIEEKRTFLQAITQFLSNVVPSWSTSSQTPSNSVDPNAPVGSGNVVLPAEQSVNNPSQSNVFGAQDISESSANNQQIIDSSGVPVAYDNVVVGENGVSGSILNTAVSGDQQYDVVGQSSLNGISANPAASASISGQSLSNSLQPSNVASTSNSDIASAVSEQTASGPSQSIDSAVLNNQASTNLPSNDVTASSNVNVNVADGQTDVNVLPVNVDPSVDSAASNVASSSGNAQSVNNVSPPQSTASGQAASSSLKPSISGSVSLNNEVFADSTGTGVFPPTANSNVPQNNGNGPVAANPSASGPNSPTTVQIDSQGNINPESGAVVPASVQSATSNGLPQSSGTVSENVNPSNPSSPGTAQVDSQGNITPVGSSVIGTGSVQSTSGNVPQSVGGGSTSADGNANPSPPEIAQVDSQGNGGGATSVNANAGPSSPETAQANSQGNGIGATSVNANVVPNSPETAQANPQVNVSPVLTGAGTGSVQPTTSDSVPQNDGSITTSVDGNAGPSSPEFVQSNPQENIAPAETSAVGTGSVQSTTSNNVPQSNESAATSVNTNTAPSTPETAQADSQGNGSGATAINANEVPSSPETAQTIPQENVAPIATGAETGSVQPTTNATVPQNNGGTTTSVNGNASPSSPETAQANPQENIAPVETSAVGTDSVQSTASDGVAPTDGSGTTATNANAGSSSPETAPADSQVNVTPAETSAVVNDSVQSTASGSVSQSDGSGTIAANANAVPSSPETAPADPQINVTPAETSAVVTDSVLSTPSDGIPPTDVSGAIAINANAGPSSPETAQAESSAVITETATNDVKIPNDVTANGAVDSSLPASNTISVSDVSVIGADPNGNQGDGSIVNSTSPVTGITTASEANVVSDVEPSVAGNDVNAVPSSSQAVSGNAIPDAVTVSSVIPVENSATVTENNVIAVNTAGDINAPSDSSINVDAASVSGSTNIESVQPTVSAVGGAGNDLTSSNSVPQSDGSGTIAANANAVPSSPETTPADPQINVTPAETSAVVTDSVLSTPSDGIPPTDVSGTTAINANAGPSSPETAQAESSAVITETATNDVKIPNDVTANGAVDSSSPASNTISVNDVSVIGADPNGNQGDGSIVNSTSSATGITTASEANVVSGAEPSVAGSDVNALPSSSQAVSGNAIPDAVTVSSVIPVENSATVTENNVIAVNTAGNINAPTDSSINIDGLAVSGSTNIESVQPTISIVGGAGNDLISSSSVSDNVVTENVVTSNDELTASAGPLIEVFRSSPDVATYTTQESISADKLASTGSENVNVGSQPTDSVITQKVEIPIAVTPAGVQTQQDNIVVQEIINTPADAESVPTDVALSQNELPSGVTVPVEPGASIVDIQAQ